MSNFNSQSNLVQNQYLQLHEDVKRLSRENKALRSANTREMEARSVEVSNYMDVLAANLWTQGSVIATAALAVTEHEQVFLLNLPFPINFTC